MFFPFFLFLIFIFSYTYCFFSHQCGKLKEVAFSRPANSNSAFSVETYMSVKGRMAKWCWRLTFYNGEMMLTVQRYFQTSNICSPD